MKSKRRFTLLGITLAILVFAGIASQQSDKTGHPVIDRAAKDSGKAPQAILIELGTQDNSPTDWSGSVQVNGAKVVHREGYRFRTEDKLTTTGWKAKSHRSIRAPRGNPIINRLEGVFTVGIILHLTDVKDDAWLSVHVKDQDLPDVKVPLKKVLAGETVKLWQGAAEVRPISAAIPVATGPTEDDNPAAAYGPDGTLWVAYTSYTLRDKNRSIESKPLPKQPKNFKSLYHPEYAEQLFVRPFKNGKGGKAIPLTGATEDIARCAVAVTADNTVWVVYNGHGKNGFDLYARSVSGQSGKVGKEVQLTTNPGSDITPAACVDTDGTIWVACQSWMESGQATISVRKCINGKWSDVPLGKLLKRNGGNHWHPVLAAGPNGRVALAYDVYRNGDYDVDVIFLNGSKLKEPIWVANTPKFEARPSLTFDKSGQLWVAFEMAPEKWGKDYGAQDSKDGNSLYNTRSVRVVCVGEGESLKIPAAPLPKLTPESPQLPFNAIKTNKFERRPRQAYPKIGVDGNGHIWLTYRENLGSRYSSHPGAIWRTFARRLDGKVWTEPIEIYPSDGLLDSRPEVLPHNQGGLAIVHNTDGRYSTPNTINNDIYLSYVNLAKTQDSVPNLYIALKAKDPRNRPVPEHVGSEREAIKEIQNYRIKLGDKELRPLRGEYHRHTEISWDGAPDGSLEDMFRYAIDAVGFDWIGNGDHDNGAGREYPWWITQKYTDAYHTAKRFVPMFTYERSVSYPHGHRNVMFAKRGIMTLPRLAPPKKLPKGLKRWPGRVHPDDTKMLYRYLHQFDGICAVHTSATGMGTDWRDNDPVVEPIVEIYQGDRMSYEVQGAPRAGFDPKTGKEPANIAGWFPLGFLDNALKNKGYKLAFQASSDHWSTHISYFVILAEEHTRESMLKAVKQRHCYGATDNIVVDLRSGDHIQGDAFETRDKPSLQFQVIGTNKIAKIDILKDSEVAGTIAPKARKYKGEWVDQKAEAGTHYYYIRVLQTDNEVAWASPMWITKR